MTQIDSAETFVQSELFSRTFREGMTLVEDTANYLDGEGRKASRTLTRSGALAYASASMRLTTQLMQIASWLLVLRAVREGEMRLDEAAQEKYRLSSETDAQREPLEDGLPDRLMTLIEDSSLLHARITRLDDNLFVSEAAPAADNDAVAQQRALVAAFGKIA